MGVRLPQRARHGARVVIDPSAKRVTRVRIPPVPRQDNALRTSGVTAAFQALTLSGLGSTPRGSTDDGREWQRSGLLPRLVRVRAPGRPRTIRRWLRGLL